MLDSIKSLMCIWPESVLLILLCCCFHLQSYMYHVHEGPWDDVGLALLGIDFTSHVFYGLVHCKN